MSISYADNVAVGAIFILRDISRHEQEEKISRQEERMQALGQLTAGIAGDLNSLHNLVGETSHELSEWAARFPESERAPLLEKTDAISRASELGLMMGGQLSQLSSPLARKGNLFVSVSGVVASVEPVLNGLGSGSMQVDIHLTDKSTLVLCHPGRLQMLLVNVFLNARERIAGSGRICISTHQAPGERVSILFELERLGGSAWQPLSFPLEMDNPDFSLSIAEAIVTAMEGSIVFKPLSETQGRLEILLPLQYSARDFIDAINRLGSVLLVGADLDILGRLEAQLEDESYAVIRCASAAEALLLGQLHDGGIDYVIADADTVPRPQRRRLLTFFESRSPQTQFVCLTSKNELDEQGWHSLPKSLHVSLSERLNRLLRPNDFAAGAC